MEKINAKQFATKRNHHRTALRRHDDTEITIIDLLDQFVQPLKDELASSEKYLQELNTKIMQGSKSNGELLMLRIEIFKTEAIIEMIKKIMV